MELNVKKCHLMVFGRHKTPTNHIYTIKDCPLDSVYQIEDLGVVLDSSLSYIPHISSIVSKSLQLLGFIKCCAKDFLNIPSIKILYCSLVRPHLDYCSCVWSPHYNTHILAIERVQHKFLRFVAFKQNQRVDEINYSNMEKSLNITSLQS
uniref:Uncharacterized protein LOC114345222 n=1 Tax=Diabrotica virgifera virgifera TaxID=50390 RepID=A0A6P7H7D6_DIAVI